MPFIICSAILPIPRPFMRMFASLLSTVTPPSGLMLTMGMNFRKL